MQFEALQQLFTDYVYQDIDGEILAAAGTSQKRLDIYKNNVLSNLINALKNAYPALLTELGENDFTSLAQQYVVYNKPVSGNLDEYGSDMFRLLFSFNEQPWLSDLARLEWACHEAFFSSDPNHVNTEELTKIPADAYEQLMFKLHSATKLLQSDYPIYQIWKNSKNGIKFTEKQCLIKEESNLIIFMRDFQLQIEPLSISEFAFLSSLKDDQPLISAYEAAIAHEESFDLVLNLYKWVVNGVFTECLYNTIT
jgi:hypothetical protein